MYCETLNCDKMCTFIQRGKGNLKNFAALMVFVCCLSLAIGQDRPCPKANEIFTVIERYVNDSQSTTNEEMLTDICLNKPDEMNQLITKTVVECSWEGTEKEFYRLKSLRVNLIQNCRQVCVNMKEIQDCSDRIRYDEFNAKNYDAFCLSYSDSMECKNRSLSAATCSIADRLFERSMDISIKRVFKYICSPGCDNITDVYKEIQRCFSTYGMVSCSNIFYLESCIAANTSCHDVWEMVPYFSDQFESVRKKCKSQSTSTIESISTETDADIDADIVSKSITSSTRQSRKRTGLILSRTRPTVKSSQDSTYYTNDDVATSLTNYKENNGKLSTTTTAVAKTQRQTFNLLTFAPGYIKAFSSPLRSHSTSTSLVTVTTKRKTAGQTRVKSSKNTFQPTLNPTSMDNFETSKTSVSSIKYAKEILTTTQTTMKKLKSEDSSMAYSKSVLTKGSLMSTSSGPSPYTIYVSKRSKNESHVSLNDNHGHRTTRMTNRESSLGSSVMTRGNISGKRKTSSTTSTGADLGEHFTVSQTVYGRRLCLTLMTYLSTVVFDFCIGDIKLLI